MPNLDNAKKALRQSAKIADRNKVVKAEIKSLRVRLRKQVTANMLDKLDETTKLLTKKVDKAVTKHVMKKNTANRIKARMMKKVNALKTQK